MLRQAPDVDAIFCGSDQIARGVARRSGNWAKVPDDIALVGFDNWTVIAEASRPPLTTIDMNLTEVGRTAARCSLRQSTVTPARHPQEPAGWSALVDLVVLAYISGLRPTTYRGLKR